MSPHTILRYNKNQQKQYFTRTGISVDIQNIGKNTEQLAVKEEESVKKIKKGVVLTTKVLDFPDGSFTNMYDLSWDQRISTVKPVIHSSNTPYSLHEEMQERPAEIATINGAFFFLADVASTTPLDLNYNLCIRDTNIKGLPTEDQPIIYIMGRKIFAKTSKARGTMLINGQKIAWIGARSTNITSKPFDATLYNARCSDVVKVRDRKTNIQIGILDTKHITTPKAKGLCDLIITAQKNGELMITAIKNGGGSHFFAGNFILQLQHNNFGFSVGDTLSHLVLDGLSLDTVTSAISVGKRISDVFFNDKIRGNRRDARSVIAEDHDGKIHFIVFDGSKYVPGFTGVSAKMIRPLFSKKHFAWAYFLDGGGSSRLIVREKNDLHVLANQFAFRKFDGLHLWDWKFARKVASSISLEVQS